MVVGIQYTAIDKWHDFDCDFEIRCFQVETVRMKNRVQLSRDRPKSQKSRHQRGSNRRNGHRKSSGICAVWWMMMNHGLHAHFPVHAIRTDLVHPRPGWCAAIGYCTKRRRLLDQATQSFLYSGAFEQGTLVPVYVCVCVLFFWNLFRGHKPMG